MNENRGARGGRWNNRWKWRGRGSWRGGPQGGWRGRGRGSGPTTTEFGGHQPRASSSFPSQDDSLVSSSSLPSQTSTAVKTFPLTDANIPLRPYMNGLSTETSESMIDAAKEFLADSVMDLEDALERKSFGVDFKKILNDEKLVDTWPTIGHDLEENAELVLGVFGIAHHQLLMPIDFSSSDRHLKKSVPVLRPRLENHEPVTPVKNIRTSLFGKLVSVQATVIRISNVRPMCTWLTFQCEKCSALMSTEQPYGQYHYPVKCVTPQCRSKTFTPQRSHDQTVTADWQSVRLQEVLFCESGRVPRTIDAELTADLCDLVAPSDVITITGVVKAMPVPDQPGVSRSGMFSLFIHAVSLTCMNKLKPSTDIFKNNFTHLDLQAVSEIHDCGLSLFKLLVASLSPSIYGHELVKAGLILGLFGGTPKHAGERTHIPVRGDPHILVVGDPGLGKSQMLLACANVAPRGIFVTATGVTTSGLTVTLSKEAGNEFVLEAGALVLADQGCCCIDEFDKMSSQHNALLEAMEQQSVSIAKSGLVCSLPARAGVLAAANPVGGHYHKAKTVSENLKMNPALLSRFDLVFILVDKPNEELDALLSDHIMNLHANKDGLSMARTSATFGSTQSLESLMGTTLKDRLRRLPGENLDLIPHELMTKYIAYARQYVFPKLSPEACDVIQKFYLELREKHQNSDCTPITTRQLESLIRLTEARAKLQLREEATGEDAEDVVEIMRETMVDIFSDGLGSLDFSRATNGSGMSSRSASKRFIAALQRAAQIQQKSTFDVTELKQILNGCGAKVSNFFDFLSSLNTQGYIIKKASGVYQLLSVDF